MTTALSQGRRFARPRRFAPAIVTGLGPVAVVTALFVGSPHQIGRLIELLIAGAVVYAISRRPAAGLITMLAFVPLQLVLLATLYRLGMPTAVVRGLGGVKEIVSAGLVLAAIQARQHGGRKFDRLDKLVLTYLTLATLYIFVPVVIPSQFPSPTTWNIRLLAWRSDALYFVVFLAVRHLVFDARIKRIAVRALFLVALLMAAAAMIEEFSSGTWNHFLVNVIRVPQYDSQVLHTTVADPTDLRSYIVVGGQKVVRAGSLLLSPITVGFYLFPALAIGFYRLTQKRVGTVTPIVCALIGATLIVTATRDAILGAVVIAVVIMQQSIQRLSPGRVRFGVLLVAIGIVAVPLASSTLVGQRSVAGLNGQQDVQEHSTSVGYGFHVLHVQPQGRGLGTAAGIGSRFSVAGNVTTEDAYLQVGDELGIAEMALFVLIILALLVALPRAPPDEVISPSALFAAGAGLAIAGLFLQVWLDFATSLTFWSIAALALTATKTSAAATPTDESREALEPASV